MRVRKILLGLLCIATIAWNYSVPVYADEQTDSVVSPQMLYIIKAGCSLSISSSGQASVEGSITGYSSLVDSVAITAELQRLVNNQWITIKTWTKTANDYRLTLSETSQVTKGYTYRAVAKVTAYSGSSSETQTVTSNQVSY